MFNVQVENHETLLSTSGMSRAEARRRVAEFKASGVKAKVVPHPVLVTDEDLAHNAQVVKEWEAKHDQIRAPYMAAEYPAEVIAEAKAALQSDDYVGFEHVGQPTDDDARQFIEMTHSGISPAPTITITEERIDGTQVLTHKEANGPIEESTWPNDLGDRIAIGNLQPGQAFYSLDGRPGTFIEMVGHDAKVSFEGKTTQWSGMSPVRLTAPIQVADKTLPNSTTTVRKPGEVRKTLFGHPPTRVVMWMGKNGYTPTQTAAVLAHYEIQSTSASIATFIRSGKKGDRGEVAPVTAEQADEIAAVVAAAAEVTMASPA